MIDEIVQKRAEILKLQLEILKLEGVVTEKSQVTSMRDFVVCREVTSDGTVANPRIQFILNCVPGNIANKLMYAEPGDNILLKMDKLRFELLEVYSVR